MDNCNFSFWALLLGIIIGNAIYTYLKAFVLAAWEDWQKHKAWRRMQIERERRLRTEVPGDRPPPPPKAPKPPPARDLPV